MKIIENPINIQTIKGRIEKYLAVNNTKTWINFFPFCIRNYNNSIHSTTGLRPNEVNKRNMGIVLKRLNKQKKIRKSIPLKLGQCVRILVDKNIFSKGYRQNCTGLK